MKVDMSPEAITARLRLAAELTDLRSDKRLEGKVVMSPPAIARRLREVESLRRACLALARLRPVQPPQP